MEAIRIDVTQYLNADWTLFLLATLLLWIPFPHMGHEQKMRWIMVRYTQPEIGRVLGNWQNHLDFLRSVVGGLVVASFEKQLGAGASAGAILWEGWLPEAIVVTGVLLQTVRVGTPVTLMAPIFYLSGLALVLPGLLEGLFAVVLGWLLVVGGRDVRCQLPAMGGGLALAGFFNQNLNGWLIALVGCIGLPLVLSLVSGRHLAYWTRQERRRGKARMTGRELVTTTKPLTA